MAQTACKLVSDSGIVDYTASADQKAGIVIEVGSIPMIVPSFIDYSEQPKGTLQFNGVWDVPQVAGVITAGDAVYWDNNGNPYGGTASSGCATGTASGNYLMGVAAPIQPNGTNATEATDSYVRVILTSAMRTATVAGSVTADDITGSDASLAVAGKAGSSGAGGIVAIAGGAGDSGAGGAITVTGGAGSGAAGGAITLTGGTGGIANVGGAVALIGGAPVSGNANGGAASFGGGAGSGTGTGGATTITTGASAGGTGTAGAMALDTGAASGGTGAGITIGGTNATTVDIGRTASTTAAGGTWTFAKMFRIPVNASVAVGGTAQANANSVGEGFTVVTGADDTAAVKLPAAVAGAVVIIKSSTASKNLIVFPGTSDAINAAAANASYNFTSDAGMGLFVAADATTWYTLPLDA